MAYSYPISARFKPLNRKIEKALASGKTVRVKTSLSLPECQYYLDQLIYNTTVLKYATYHTYKTLKETDAIRLKQGKTYCVFVVNGADLSALVAECLGNRDQANKVIKKLGITAATPARKAINQIKEYLYYFPHDDNFKWANGLFHGIGGNCAAYASAFKTIMNLLGYPCEFLIGWTDGYCHAWNRVKISGVWFYIDLICDMRLSQTLWKAYEKITERF